MLSSWAQLVIPTPALTSTRKLSEESKGIIRRLLKTDMSLSAISREAGCSVDAVKRLSDREGLR